MRMSGYLAVLIGIILHFGGTAVASPVLIESGSLEGAHSDALTIYRPLFHMLCRSVSTSFSKSGATHQPCVPRSPSPLTITQVWLA